MTTDQFWNLIHATTAPTQEEQVPARAAIVGTARPGRMYEAFPDFAKYVTLLAQPPAKNTNDGEPS